MDRFGRPGPSLSLTDGRSGFVTSCKRKKKSGCAYLSCNAVPHAYPCLCSRALRALRFCALLVCFALALAACDAGPSTPDGGGGITPGLPAPEIHSSPRWSPDGRWILYWDAGITRYDPATNRAERDLTRRGLWAITPDGTTRRMLVRDAYSGDWSPDGRAITFEKGAQIYTASLSDDLAVDSSSVVQLTRSGRNFEPSWSPDGVWIAFDSSTEDAIGPDGVRIVRVGGTGLRRIGSGRVSPSWYPDGKSVISASGQGAISPETRFLRHYPFEARPGDTLRVRPGIENYDPEVSPDGRTIVFASSGGIWLRSLDGTVLHQIRPDGGRYPDWSPDGRRIAYVGPNLTLWVMDADGKNPRALTTRPE